MPLFDKLEKAIGPLADVEEPVGKILLGEMDQTSPFLGAAKINLLSPLFLVGQLFAARRRGAGVTIRRQHS